jgi:hypothetical protein
MERVIEPALTDLQVEYAQALRGPRYRQRWTLLRGYIAFFKVACLSGLHSLRPSAWSPEDRHSLKRTAGLSAGMTVLVIAFFQSGRVIRLFSTTDSMALGALLLAPWLSWALTVYLPFGMMIGILFGLRGRNVSRVPVFIILTGALVIGGGIFVNTQWVIPSAYRTLGAALSVSPNRPKDPYQLSLRELRERIRWEETNNFPTYAKRLTIYYHERTSALPLAPFATALFALAVVTRRRNGRILLALVSFVGVFGYGALELFGAVFANVRAEPPYIDREWTKQFFNCFGALPPFAAAWCANMTTVLAAAAIAMFVPGRVRMSQ